ncbi:hypothetical protein B0H14DRAFT_2651343 [Mycena olivaceomarginata]|nr:hypothetical protein B0H14DRAFT_2651343 [Mycena olivaceomarginata]
MSCRPINAIYPLYSFGVVWWLCGVINGSLIRVDLSRGNTSQIHTGPARDTLGLYSWGSQEVSGKLPGSAAIKLIPTHNILLVALHWFAKEYHPLATFSTF